MGSELRDYGDTPFKKGDVDAAVVKKYLSSGRQIDEVVFNKLGISKDQLDHVSEDDILAAFNSLMDQQTLQQYIEVDKLNLRPQIQQHLSIVHEATIFGKGADKETVRKLNRALLYATYIQDTVNVRKYERFESVALLKTNVILKPLPLKSSNTIKGMLVNISAGGMALILKDSIAVGTQLLLQAEFHDRTVLSAEVEIKHGLDSGGKHIYGFEFLNLPNFQVNKFQRMSRDFNDCEAKIKNHTLKYCRLDCAFYPLCTKPQKQ